MGEKNNLITMPKCNLYFCLYKKIEIEYKNLFVI